MLKKGEIQVVKSLLGEDFFEALEKSGVNALIDPKNQVGIQPEEIKVALQIVPRAILSFLFYNLQGCKNGDVRDISLPFVENAIIHINKLGFDNYSGEIIKDGERLIKFQHRSLPALGLVILSTFELYDLDLLSEIKSHRPSEEGKGLINTAQKLIDERFLLNNLVESVVDRKMSERDAIGRLIKEKLQGHIESVVKEDREESHVMEQSKKSKLKQFIETRERKREQPIELMDKAEIKCPDCRATLHKKEDDSIKLCICYGENMNKDIKIKKSEDGRVKLNFPKSFDIENIEMILESLKSGN